MKCQHVVYHSKAEKRVRAKAERLKDGAMEQDDGFGFWVRSLAEVVDVAVGAQATDDRGAGCGVNGLALGTDEDFAIVANADAGLLAPDIGPPRTGRGRPQHGAFLCEGLFAGGVRSRAQFAVDFVLVGVGQEVGAESSGPFAFADLIGGQQWGLGFLPV